MQQQQKQKLQKDGLYRQRPESSSIGIQWQANCKEISTIFHCSMLSTTALSGCWEGCAAPLAFRHFFVFWWPLELQSILLFFTQNYRSEEPASGVQKTFKRVTLSARTPWFLVRPLTIKTMRMTLEQEENGAEFIYLQQEMKKTKRWDGMVTFYCHFLQLELLGF